MKQVALLVCVITPLLAQPESVADRMLAQLARVAWNTPYQVAHDQNCRPVPVHPSLNGGLHDYAYHCSANDRGVASESFYYPAAGDPPSLVLQRTDLSLADPNPDVERALRERLNRQYGTASASDRVFEIAAYPGLTWHMGRVTIFLHHNRLYVEPGGIRTGMQLIAVRNEVLELRTEQQRVTEALRTSTPLSGPVLASDLSRDLGGLYDGTAAEPATRAALLTLLEESGSGDHWRRAAILVAADSLAVRLGTLLVTRRGTESLDADSVRQQFAPYGIHYSGIGHNSGVLEYDRNLLTRAWKDFPDTPWGQRAFLMLQRLSCSSRQWEAEVDVALPVPCPGPECFRVVIRAGEEFLRRNPEAPLRREEIFQLALAYETWWSLGQAALGDPTAEGAKVDKPGADSARLRAIALYEELIRTAPGSAEAMAAKLRLPRLRLALDTGERTFFCFAC